MMLLAIMPNGVRVPCWLDEDEDGFVKKFIMLSLAISSSSSCLMSAMSSSCWIVASK